MNEKTLGRIIKDAIEATDMALQSAADAEAMNNAAEGRSDTVFIRPRLADAIDKLDAGKAMLESAFGHVDV